MTLLVLASLCTATDDAHAQGSPETDRAALVAIYNATDGPNWTDNTNWLSDAPLSAWHGVTTDADERVVELNLERGKLSGRLPPEIGDLENLRVLELTFNELSGPIPPELSDLDQLEVLDFAFNGLSGPIPPELSDLGNLRGLELGGNGRTGGLTGSIPPELGNVTSLESLSIWGNFLTGSIPPELGNLAGLGHLDLGNNDLTGPIPAELAETSLRFLSLYSNELTGTIPSEFRALTGLRGLDLEENDLSGPIPPWLGELTALFQLELGGNRFTGDISVLGELNLDYLELDFNEGLTGPLPPGLLRQRIWRLKLAGTMVCVPADEAFQDWVTTIEEYQSSGLTCGEPVPELSTIDVALFYTPAARREAGGTAQIEATMDLWVAEANQAYIDSAVKQQIALVAMQEVDYTEVDVHADLWRLTNLGEGHLDEVHEIRDEVGADLVHLVPNWVEGYGACGKGWIVEPLPFAVTVYECGGMAFTHELGHNMGLQHDRYTVCGPNAAFCEDWPFRYAFGYVNQRAFEPRAPESARWLTIMAYSLQCNDVVPTHTAVLEPRPDLERRPAGRAGRLPVIRRRRAGRCRSRPQPHPAFGGGPSEPGRWRRSHQPAAGGGGRPAGPHPACRRGAGPDSRRRRVPRPRRGRVDLLGDIVRAHRRLGARRGRAGDADSERGGRGDDLGDGVRPRRVRQQRDAHVHRDRTGGDPLHGP